VSHSLRRAGRGLAASLVLAVPYGPGVDIASLAFRTDLALLALAGSEVDDQGSHVVVRTRDNPGFRWGNFHLLAHPPRPDEVDATLARYDADFPDSAHRTFGIDGTADQAQLVQPLVAAGLNAESATVMTATSVNPPPRPNAEAVYRQLDTDDDWSQRIALSVSVDSEEAAQEGYLAYATQRADADRSLCEAGHAVWWGAFVDGQLASVMGLVDAGGGLARYQSVETHVNHRGRGLAGTLVHRVATYGVEEMGARILVMVADPDYLAIRIYRSVGFQDTETQTMLEQKDRTSES